MSFDHGRACAEEPCDYCQKLAEERAEPDYADDPGGQEQWERYLDRLGEA